MPRSEPRVQAPKLELPEVPVELPQPQPASARAGEGASPGGNMNVSVRIFSPGDDGPVTQVNQGGGGSGASGPAATAAPLQWIWNWTWIGAPGCDPGPAGNSAPALGVAEWTWNWTWSCGDATAPVDPPVVDVPAIDVQLPRIEVLPNLPRLDVLPELEQLATTLGAVAPVVIPSAGDQRAAAQLPAATGDGPANERDANGRERRAEPARPDGLVKAGSSLSWAAAPLATVGPAARQKHALERHPKRDIARKRSVIPAADGPSGATFFAAAAPPGGGAAPATLPTIALLVLSFLGGALLAAVGLPRQKPRAERLERPG